MNHRDGTTDASEGSTNGHVAAKGHDVPVRDANGHGATNGHANGSNGHAAANGNGHGHAHANGHTNGQANDLANGHAIGPHLIDAHGGTLVSLFAGPEEAAALEWEAESLPSITVGPRRQADLELLANGAYSPLRGFMDKADFDSVLDRSRLASGIVWTIPITLDVDAAAAAQLSAGDRVALRDTRGILLAVLDLTEKYLYDREHYARAVFGTTETAHPGVAKIHEQGDWLLGGPITLVRRPETIEFPAYHLDPVQTRALIRERGWRTVVGFQTRNPIHRAHEFILKSSLEIFDALMIQPLVGETRPEDIPADVRLRCYEALIEGYYPKDRTFLTVLPAVMRFAGPREAVFHALIRKNYGCTHFIVGRDHAGVGNYYGTYDAQKIFDRFTPEEIGIQPLRFEHTFYCHVCQGMASFKTCPHPTDKHLTLSGTRVREMLAQKEIPPAEFTRPEVARILMEMSGGRA
jgi:sulfate adenylyltransferase